MNQYDFDAAGRAQECQECGAPALRALAPDVLMVISAQQWFQSCGGVALVLLALLVSAQNGWTQKAAFWRISKQSEGLPVSACVSVSVSPQGKVLARYANPAVLCEADGYTIKTFPLPESAVGRVLESPGGQPWVLGTNGLEEYKDGAWITRPVPGVSPMSLAGIPFYPLRQGHVVLLFPDRLAEFNGEDPAQPSVTLLRSVEQTRLERFLDLTVTADGALWITGARGLAKFPGPFRSLKADSSWQEFIPPTSMNVRNLREPLADDDGVTLVGDLGTNRQRAVVRFDGQVWSVEETVSGLLHQAWRGPAGSRWAMVNRSLLQHLPAQRGFVENDDISARNYYDVATEPGGGFWLATSEGLFHCASLLWRCPPGLVQSHSPTLGLAADVEDRLWFISGNSLCSLDAGQLRAVALPPGTDSPRGAGSIYVLKDGSLVFEVNADLGQDKESELRLMRYLPAKGRFEFLPPAESGRQLKALGLLTGGALCLQNFNPALPDEPYRLEQFNGTNRQPLSGLPPAPFLGPGLYAIQALENGDLWLSGELGTAWLHEQKWRSFVSSDKSSPEGALVFQSLPEGKLACAARDRVWRFDGQTWTLLRRGFDRINTLAATRDGSLWVGSNNGIRRWFQGAWIANGTEDGLPDPDVRRLCEDSHGLLWAATSQGLSRFHPEADADPPQTFIHQRPGEGKQIPEGDTATLTFSGVDRWRYTPSDQLLYSYRLDEHDWSAFDLVNGVSFADLPAGKHSFRVRAMDRAGNIEARPVQFEFVVTLPWYRETRLVLISFVGLVTALFFAGLSFNRHRRLLRSYAEVEKKVALRTRELEIASRELLHSQKMNALGTIAAGIAHDFNNILSIIKGSAQIIEENLDNPQKVRTRVERIKTVVEQGSGIVQAMLGFSRDSGQQAGPCDLNKVVEDTIKLLGDRFLHEVQVAFQPALGLPVVSAMKDFVQQILLNLIFNAAESMSQKKQIWVSTRLLRQLPAGLALAPGAAPSYVAISVADSGCGIPPENLSRIFEPFFTTKALSTRRGTGLGLSMVYQLASKLEAGLAVDSQVGRGSTFTLILPARPQPAQPEPAHAVHA